MTAITRRPTALPGAKVSAQTALAKVQNRFDERVLHVPTDLAVIVAAVSSLATGGAIVIVVAVCIALIGMVVFAA